MFLCKPEINEFLVTIERTDKWGYPEKPTRGSWELGGELIPCGANFPGGRAEIRQLIQRLREVINPNSKRKEPWSDFLAFDPSFGLMEEIKKFDIDLSPTRDQMEIWLTLDQKFSEIKNALLLVKLFAELRDETGVERNEVKLLGLVSNLTKKYYKTDTETRKWALDDNGERIVEKRIDTYYYLGITNAEGLPRVTYRKEIIGSAWFDFSKPSNLLYPGCLNFLKRSDIQHILRDYKKRQKNELAAIKNMHTESPPEEPDYEKLFTGMGRDE